MKTIWQLSNEARAMALQVKFQTLGIDSSMPGFCDSPHFLLAESKSPEIMESYAEFVETRPYSAEYLAEAEQKVALVAEVVRQAVKKDGKLGACVHASSIIARMLDQLGIWNYVAKATLTIKYPRAAKLPDSFFWALDKGGVVAPHAIVVAPPFAIVDVTLSYQPFSGRHSDYLPEAVVADQFNPKKWEPQDLISDERLHGLKLRRTSVKDYMRVEQPRMLDVIKRLPPRGATSGETTMKYVIVAIGGFVEQLDDIKGYQPGGRTARQIFDQDVLPQVDR